MDLGYSPKSPYHEVSILLSIALRAGNPECELASAFNGLILSNSPHNNFSTASLGIPEDLISFFTSSDIESSFTIRIASSDVFALVQAPELHSKSHV